MRPVGSRPPLFTYKGAGGDSYNNADGGAQVGVLFYTGNTFPAAYREKVFIGQVRGYAGNLELMSPDGKTLASRNVSGRSRVEFLIAARGIHVLNWSDGIHCGSVKPIL